MALTQREYTIREGADAGRVFVIQAMPVIQAARWATRCVSAMARCGVPIPESAMGAPIPHMAALGMQALLLTPPHEHEPLFDELYETACKLIQTEAGPRTPLSTETPSDIQTIFELRQAAHDLNFGFFKRGAPLTSPAESQAPAPNPENSPTIQIPPPKSRQS